MKLTLILLTAAFCTAAANGVSQTVTLSTSNATVQEIMAAVRKQTGYVFFYQKNTLNGAKKVTVTARQLPVNDFLNVAFKEQPFSWSIENQTIILESKPNVPPKLSNEEQAGNPLTPVKIQVLDENGKLLAEASVSVDKTSKMALTNKDGIAILDVAVGDIVTISYVGYENRQVKITNETINGNLLTVTLKLKQSTLDDIVVIGYGTQRKSDVTGALTRVTEQTIKERPVMNVAQALQGKASGLNVATNIKPGEMPAIRIRGTRSANASNDPLYVVDGIPIVSQLGVSSFSVNDLNPNDIASVEILKDASATAIYGSRGANGVILITTKKGAKGKVTLGFNSNVTLDSYKDLADRLSGGEYIDRLRYALMNGRRYQAGNPGDLNVAPVLWYPDPRLDSANFAASQITNNYSELLAATMKGYAWNPDGSVAMRPTTDDERAMGWPAMVPDYNAGRIPTYDWIGSATRTGVTHNHQLSISAGNEISKLYISLGYNKQLGVQRDQDFTRFNLNLNGEVTATKWFTLGLSMLASLAKQNFGMNENLSNTGAKDLFGRAASMFPWAFPTDSSGAYIRNPGGNLSSWNPLIDIGQSINERRAASAFSNLHAEIKFFPWLKYRVNFGAQIRNTRNGSWTGPDVTSHLSARANTAGYERQEHFSWIVENLLYFDKTFAKAHKLGITLLQSSQHSRSENTGISVNGTVIPLSRWYDLGSNTAGNPAIGTGFTENKLSSFMGRVNYALLDKYLLTASGRFDGSSVLAPGHKWAFFPSFALAWKMQEEAFLQKITWLNELKPRLGYGVTGNSSVNPYTTSGPLGRNNYAFGAVPAIGFLPESVKNPDLGWEQTAQTNIGIDFTILNSRISGSVEYYTQQTSDLIFERSLPAVSGYVTKFMNIGKSRNRGIEVTLNTVNIKKGDFTWSTEMNWSRNREEIVELINGKQDMLAARQFIGQPWQVFYQLQSDGIWGSTSKDLAEMAQFKAIGGLDFRPGTVKVVDQNGDYKIAAEDYVIRGTPRPKWYGGITNTFRYKGFTLSSFIYARVGQTYFGGYQGVFGQDFGNMWSWNNQRGKWPLPVLGASAITNISSAVQYQDGSFAIVRNISLIYDVPAKILNLAKMKSLQLNVQVLNPFIIGGKLVKLGINPDDETEWTDESSPNSFTTSPNGGMNNNSILPRSIVFGLRASF
ncbi:SusC/RagA family TonB-linked outer membrane protein [Longitalea luteola]|uniref:SusC/RagA family TonB-linked outer membrane protein n=1 Tax=Longitalea luteola TaxID=2812563 RepID=UPI001A9629BB|nr:SusC/RagA family TonB-linked outer membrane protein [Longitalea luteola]